MKKSRTVAIILLAVIIISLFNGCKTNDEVRIEDFQYNYAYTYDFITLKHTAASEYYADKLNAENIEEMHITLKDNIATITDTNGNVVYSDTYTLNAQGSDFITYNFPKKDSATPFDTMIIDWGTHSYIETDYKLTLNFRTYSLVFEATAK